MFHQFRRCITPLGLLWRSAYVKGPSANTMTTASFPRAPPPGTQPLVNQSRDDRKMISLYPVDKDDPVLESVHDQANKSAVEQVLDTYDSISPEELSPKDSCETLFNLWDLIMDTSTSPSPGIDIEIDQLRKHPMFKRIVSHIVSSCDQLEDDLLATSLFCLLRLKFKIDEPKCQELLGELLKRKETLELSALSTVCVVLGREATAYSKSIFEEFTPRLRLYHQRMKTNSEVYLVSVAMRAAGVMLPRKASDCYIWNMRRLFNDSSIKLEPLTLCEMLSFLSERCCMFQASPSRANLRPEDQEITTVAADMLRRVGNELIPHVKTVIDERLMSDLPRFLIKQKDPAGLIEAIVDYVTLSLEGAENNIQPELLPCVKPTRMKHLIQLKKILKDILADFDSFTRIHGGMPAYEIAFSLVDKKCTFEKAMFDRLWSLSLKLLEQCRPRLVVSDIVKYDEDRRSVQSCGEIAKPLELNDFALKYFHFRYRVSPYYRHAAFESFAARLLRNTLEDYEQGKCEMCIQDYVVAISFLIATGRLEKSPKINETMLHEFTPSDLLTLAKAVQLSPSKRNHIVNSMEEQSKRLVKKPLVAAVYLRLAKANLLLQKGDSSRTLAGKIFKDCLQKAVEAHWWDDRTASDLLRILISAGYNFPEALEKVSRYICYAGNDVGSSCADKFAEAVFLCGAGYYNALKVVATSTERNAAEWHPRNLLRSMLCFCYYGVLSQDLIRKVFSQRFLQELDQRSNFYPQGSVGRAVIRDLLMQVNRAVCIDMPKSGMEWLREKHVRNKPILSAAAGSSASGTTHMCGEVLKGLQSIVGAKCVSQNVLLPYFYVADFQLRLDQRGYPLPTKAKNKATAEKLVVLVHKPEDYTNGVRRLKGPQLLKRRHLQKLGFRVIEIDPASWSGEQLRDEKAKTDYLQKLISRK